MKGEASGKARTFRLARKAITIQYGYRKCGTHARVFSQTLEHGDSKNDIRQRKKKECEKRVTSMDKADTEIGHKKNSDGLTIVQAYCRLPRVTEGKGCTKIF